MFILSLALRIPAFELPDTSKSGPSGGSPGILPEPVPGRKSRSYVCISSGFLLSVELPGKFIGPDTVHGLGGEKRSYLFLLAFELFQGFPDHIFRYVGEREQPVHVFLQVVGRRGGSEADARYVFLFFRL